MRIALAQVDSTIGEVEANLELMRVLTDEANSHRADLVVFPELAAHGYALGGAHVHRKLYSSADLGPSVLDTMVGREVVRLIHDGGDT